MSRRVGRADPNSVRRWNEFAVITALRENSPQRISSLTEVTGLTPAPLGDVLRRLEEKQWVEVLNPTPGGMGRPAQQFGLLKHEGYLLGLDFGGRSIRGVVIDLDGEVKHRAERKRTPDAKRAQDVATITEVIEECVGAAPGPYWLTCMGISGFVGQEGDLRLSHILNDWEGINPADELADALPSRMVLINDVRALGMAELRNGASDGVDDFLLVHLGRRPTMVLVMDGFPRRGAHGTSGGLAKVDSGIIQFDGSWLEPWSDADDPLATLLDAVRAGDQKAIDAMVEHVKSLVPPLAVAATMMDPELTIIAGPLASVGEHFKEPLAERLFEGLSGSPELRLSPLDEYGVAHGAALMALQVLHDTLADETDGAQPFTQEEFASHPLPSL